jgi:hypothetical protein
MGNLRCLLLLAESGWIEGEILKFMRKMWAPHSQTLNTVQAGNRQPGGAGRPSKKTSMGIRKEAGGVAGFI